MWPRNSRTKVRETLIQNDNQYLLCSRFRFEIASTQPLLAKHLHLHPSRQKLFSATMAPKNFPRQYFVFYCIFMHQFIHLRTFSSKKAFGTRKRKCRNPSLSGRKLNTFYLSRGVIMHHNVSKLFLNSISDVCRD